jgi:hypothetical protein
MAIEDVLSLIEDDLAEIKRWIVQHKDEHTADTRLLASIVDSLTVHENNHHGSPSRLALARSGGIVAAITSVLIIVAEVIRYITLG